MTSMQTDRLHRPLLGIGLRLGAMIMFSVLAVLIKLLTKSGLPEIELIFFRSLFGLIPVLVWIAVFRRPGIVKTTKPKAHLMRALLGLAAMGCMFVGLARMPLSDATAIGFATPIFATLLSGILLSERIGLHRWIAILVGFGGVLILTRIGSANLIGSGAFFMLMSAIIGAAVSVTIRQISKTEHSVTITFYFMLAGTVITGAMLPFIWVTPDPQSWLLLVGLGLTGGLLQLLLSASLRYAPVPTVMPFDYSQIVFVGLWSWFLWSELPDLQTIIGGTIIIFSGLYIFYREAVRRVAPTPVASPVDEG